MSLSRKVIILSNWISEKKYFPRTVLFLWKLVMDKNQFLFIVANKMFLMIIDKGRNTIINTNLELKQTDEYFPNDICIDNRGRTCELVDLLERRVWW